MSFLTSVGNVTSAFLEDQPHSQKIAQLSFLGIPPPFSVPQFHPDTKGPLCFSKSPPSVPTFSTLLLQYCLVSSGFSIGLAASPSVSALTQTGPKEKSPQLSALCKGYQDRFCGLIQPHSLTVLQLPNCYWLDPY